VTAPPHCTVPSAAHHSTATTFCRKFSYNVSGGATFTLRIGNKRCADMSQLAVTFVRCSNHFAQVNSSSQLAPGGLWKFESQIMRIFHRACSRLATRMVPLLISGTPQSGTEETTEYRLCGPMALRPGSSTATAAAQPGSRQPLELLAAKRFNRLDPSLRNPALKISGAFAGLLKRQKITYNVK